MNFLMLEYFRIFILLFAFLFSIGLQAVQPNNSSIQQNTVDEESLDAAGNAVKPSEPVNENLNGIVNEVEKIKQEIIKINQDLYRFQESLLYPANTQLAIFLSYAENSAFVLDSIEINLDGQLVASALYRDTEIGALKKGGIQRVYLGSLSDGKHKLSIQFNGQGQNDRYFRRKKILSFLKEEQARYIQLIVSDNNSTGEPVFKVKQW
ncbi:MAG: hypothetical protein ACJAS1_002933 [Oleiphilaceae bacterium]|jgi:hypothetical protein